MKDKILEYLEKDARTSASTIAAALGMEPAEVAAAIAAYEKDGTILSYRTVVDWSKAGGNGVQALIELKTIPQRDRGFDGIAERIARYPEVRSVYLMSGGFDLALLVECPNMRDVAQFVAERLATIEGVTATATLIKMGAAPTLILRDGECRRIEANTPPAGIMRDIIAEKKTFSVRRGDVIVMLSDGVLQTGDNAAALGSLKSASAHGAQQMATAVLERAEAAEGAGDDMSVCVLRFY